MNARLSVTLTAAQPSLIATAPHSALANKSIVIAHDELGFELLHRVHGYTDDNQQRSAAKIELHIQPVENKAPHMLIEPIAYQPQVLQVNAGDHPFRQQTNDGQINSAHKRQARQNAIYIFRCVPSRTNSGYKPAILAHVVRKLRRIKNDAHVKKCEKDDERHINQGVERLAPLDRIRQLSKKRRLALKEQSQSLRKGQQRTRKNRRNHAP